MNKQINSLESLYNCLELKNSENNLKAQLMVLCRHWFAECNIFDSRTGFALSTDLDSFIRKNIHFFSSKQDSKIYQDRLYVILSYVSEALTKLTRNTKQNIIREHAMLPVYAVREVDTQTVQWLSYQPGRNIKQKLSGKPYMKSVRRKHSANIAENRVLNALIKKIQPLLYEREALNYFGFEPLVDDLISLTQRWMHDDDNLDIGDWHNLPPNNTLLQHEFYSKIWKGWLAIQNLDDDIANDSRNIASLFSNYIYWQIASTILAHSEFSYVQRPLHANYEQLEMQKNLISNSVFTIDGQVRRKKNEIKRYLGKISALDKDKTSGILEYLDEENNRLSLTFILSPELIDNLLSLTIKDKVWFVHSNNKTTKANVEVISQYAEASRKQEIDDYEIFKFGKNDNSLIFTIGKKTVNISVALNSLTLTKLKNHKSQKVFKITNFQDIDKAIKQIVEFIIPNYVDSKPISVLGTTHQVGTNQKRKFCIIEAETLCPVYLDESNELKQSDEKLIFQYWNDENGGLYEINGTYARALQLNNVETFSFKSILSESSESSNANKLNAAVILMKNLKQILNTDELIYLVNDEVNDFTSENLRKAVNLNFNKSEQIPMSIAIAFDYLKQNKLKENDIILNVSANDSQLVITPLRYILQKEPTPKKILIKGYLERHPALVIERVSFMNKLKAFYESHFAHSSSELLTLFGAFTIDKIWDNLSIVQEEHSESFLSECQPEFMELIGNRQIRRADLKKLDNKFSIDEKQNVLHILSTKINKNDIELNNHIRLETNLSSLEGASYLYQLQKQYPDIVFWKDHLPQLSIKVKRDGVIENFYLVKDTTIEPKRGVKQSIAINQEFILPKGRPFYEFPLQQGEGNSALRYKAYLRSNQFPLSQDVSCKLQMTYEYGAEVPYTLVFKPTNTSILPLKVEWRENDMTQVDLTSLTYPSYPMEYQLADFYKFNSIKGGHIDLMEWILRIMKSYTRTPDELYKREVSDPLANRVEGLVDFIGKDKHGHLFIKAKTSSGVIFCHSSKFFEKMNENNLSIGQKVYFHIKVEKSMEYGQLVTHTELLPRALTKALHDNFNDSFKSISALKFPMLTIWSNGFSLLQNQIIGEEVKLIINRFIGILTLAVTDSRLYDRTKEEIYYILSIMHQDTPQFIKDKLKADAFDIPKAKLNARNIAYGLGDLSHDWQIEIFNHIKDTRQAENYPNTYLVILGIAAWRTRGLVDMIDIDNFKFIAEKLPSVINKYFDKYKAAHKTGKSKFLIDLKLSKVLELLLALLRTRESKDDSYKIILAPNQRLTDNLIRLIEEIKKFYDENKIKFKSYIKFDFVNNEEVHQELDLFYVLNLYLSGDDNANAIHITGVSDE